MIDTPITISYCVRRIQKAIDDKNYERMEHWKHALDNLIVEKRKAKLEELLRQRIVQLEEARRSDFPNLRYISQTIEQIGVIKSLIN